ncbi:MAG: PorT family protein [Bacteroidetes bacterium]|nr:PorT family protein [Bacteroidota bacterium]
MFFALQLLLANYLYSQDAKVPNLPKYYRSVLNFGFYLGVNRADFSVISSLDKPDSILVIESAPKTGFNLGIMAEVRLHEYVTLRFLPDLAFSERNIQFQMKDSKGEYLLSKQVESTFLDFPLNIKYRSKRLNNFGAYVVGGGRYTIDLASQKDVKTTNPNEAIIKLNNKDFAYELGTGLDFYLTYFKFGIEFKWVFGLSNILVRDNFIYSKSLDKLNSRMFLLSFTFEG